MGKHKQQEQPDRHLEAPAEANRDKHINFLEEEKDRLRNEASLSTMNNASLPKRRENNNRNENE